MCAENAPKFRLHSFSTNIKSVQAQLVPAHFFHTLVRQVLLSEPKCGKRATTLKIGQSVQMKPRKLAHFNTSPWNCNVWKECAGVCGSPANSPQDRGKCASRLFGGRRAGFQGVLRIPSLAYYRSSYNHTTMQLVTTPEGSQRPEWEAHLTK